VPICNVGQMRWPINRVTGWLEMIEVPRSPRTSCPIHATNCTCSGSARPSAWRMRSNCSEVAESPAMIAAGSPGVSRRSRKTKIATIAITGITARTRRMI